MAKRTPFYDFHVSLGGKMVDFAGWELPIAYKRGIIEEHKQCRSSGSIFDISHMGRINLSGRPAGEFLDRVLTRKVADQAVGQSRYSLVCNEAGGVLDDVIVSRDTKNWIVVCNGANREKILNHLTSLRRKLDLDLDISDQTEGTAMIAVQGPKVMERIGSALPGDVKKLKRYHFVTVSMMFVKFTVFRSGYTGEDGLEIILPAKMAGMAMKMIGGRVGEADATIQVAGLGARDTLRLEAGMPLYGHELSENVDPISAGLSWAVDLSKDFIGAEALRKIAAEGPKRKLVGLELDSKRIARQGYAVLNGETPAGEVTSGTFGPTVNKSIAMAYVDAALAEPGTKLSVDLKGEKAPATVVKLPFYKRV